MTPSVLRTGSSPSRCFSLFINPGPQIELLHLLFQSVYLSPQMGDIGLFHQLVDIGLCLSLADIALLLQLVELVGVELLRGLNLRDL